MTRESGPAIYRSNRELKALRLPPHVLAGLGVSIFALLFALYTQHAWEDWYITFRPAKNLAIGHGLVFNEGERVHTFTSVIGVLLPALLSFATFNVSDDLTLWLFRFVCSGALGLAAALLVKASRMWFSGLVPVVLLVGGAAVDAKTVDFSINGMETPFTLLGVSLFLYFVTTRPVNQLGIRLGVVWALFQYTRPDGFVYALLLMTGMVFFLKDRRKTLRALVVSCGVGALLFAPWFLFATWYYGSAVPHSLLAKQALLDNRGSEYFLARAESLFRSLFLLQRGTFDFVFTPPYASYFSFQNFTPALVASRILGVIAAVVWVFPGIGAPGRMASFAFLGGLFYLAVFTPFLYPWYIPVTTLLALVSLAFALDAFRRFLGGQIVHPAILKYGPATMAACVLLYGFAQTAVTAHQFRFAQRAIEDGQRRQIGMWLKSQSGSQRETVFLESAGYIGFFSGLKLYDYPGMTAPETVAARRLLQSNDWLMLIKQLQPDWIVLRPKQELMSMWRKDSVFMMTHYRVVKIFDANAAIDSLSFKPYESYLRHDAEFVVAKRIR